MENEILNAALNYAKRGWAVVPISRDKIPFIKWKEEDGATAEYLKDPENIKSWWSKWPAANVAIITGKRSGGLVVIDIDISEDEGKYGDESISEWEDTEGEGCIVDSDMIVRTGRGGKHLYFTSTESFGSATGCLQDVDIRGEGGLVVAPPSVHASTRRTYEWEDCDFTDDVPSVQEDPGVEYFLHCMFSKRKKNEEKENFKIPEVVTKGSRDSTLFKALCKLQQDGLSDEVIREVAYSYNASFDPPLEDKVVEQKIKQALKYEKGNKNDGPEEKEETTSTNEEGKTVYKREFKGKSGRKITEEFTEDDLNMPTLNEFERRTKNWLVPGWIPEGCVTLLCSDGGIGKTSIWCDTLAKLTTGSPTIFDKALGNPFRTGECKRVMYFSKEDSTEEVLTFKIDGANSNGDLINTFGIDDKHINSVWYGSFYLEKLIEKYKPAICVFDTLQAFLPDGVDMAKRKDMRDSLDPLNQLGAKYKTSFLLIMHSNKSSNSGRQRMADSSDIWDLGRSAIMAGKTREKGIMYMSHEKSNYGKLQDTILFSVEDDGLKYKGTSKKKDADFIADRASFSVPSPKRDEAKQFILDQLKEAEGNRMEINKLSEVAKAAGIKEHTLDDARAELVGNKEIIRKNEGIGPSKKWILILQQKENGE